MSGGSSGSRGELRCRAKLRRLRNPLRDANSVIKSLTLTLPIAAMVSSVAKRTGVDVLMKSMAVKASIVFGRFRNAGPDDLAGFGEYCWYSHDAGNASTGE